ncbi:MAG TPA: GNAT family N-acetyltransferase, partial [Bacillales bacterium]|nr:GNAT family N-acetyltransferase [Bacillales bacterium]
MKWTALEKSHLPEAAGLLAERHLRERESFPGLPPRYKEDREALRALTASWEKPNTMGMAAFEQNKMKAYVLGHVKIDAERGRCVWMEYADAALAPEADAEIFRDLYAVLAEKWVKVGCFTHYVFVPLGNPAILEAWLKLGFAYQQAYAMADLSAVDGGNSEFDQAVRFRMAEEGDRKALREASDWISVHQSRSPAFNPILPEVSNEIEDGYAGILEDEEADLWLAENNEGDSVGFQAFWPVGTAGNDLTAPEKSAVLKVAATKPEARRAGIGTALTRYTFSELKKRGCRYCVTDWHILNVLSSRFWPKRGFQP